MQENLQTLILNDKGTSIFFSTLFFMGLMGFIYGYALSFVFRIKKILTISFVAIFLTCILVVMYTIMAIYSGRCITPYHTNCFPVIDDSTIFTYFWVILSQSIINLFVGIAGTLLGVGISLPTMLIMRIFFGKSFTKNETEEVHEPERFDSYKSSILYNKPAEIKPILKEQSEFTKTSLFNKGIKT